jgi:hypothetical protein
MGLVSLVAIVIGGSTFVVLSLAFRWRFSRRALAASLIGEIAEILTVIDAHDLSDALRATMDHGTLFCAPPPQSTIVYKGNQRRLGLLGSHNVRLIASFYSCAESLNGELHALAADTSRNGRKYRARFAATELDQLFELGNEALRNLRPFIERKRSALLIRA